MPTYLAIISAYDSKAGTSEQKRVVEAKTEAAALKHVVGQHIIMSRPTNRELVALGADGIQIESAE